MKHVFAKMNQLRFFLLVIFPLGIGAFIYLLNGKMNFSLSVRNYLPDALWAFAFANCWFLIADDSDTMSRTASLLISLLLIVVVELSQLLQFIPGTFDPVDLPVMISSCLFSFFILHLKKLTSTKTQSS